MNDEVVNEIAEALKKIESVLENLARISGFTEWAMFIVSLAIAGVAILISVRQSNKSSAALVKIEELAKRIEADNANVISRLLTMQEKSVTEKKQSDF